MALNLGYSYATNPGPSTGAVERTISMNPDNLGSKNGLVTGTTQTELFKASGKTVIYGLWLFNTTGSGATYTLRKRAATASDANDQRLAVTKTVAANSPDTTFVPTAGHLMVLEAGEALYLTSSATNTFAYNLSYSTER